jgi:16S rRNA (cytosine967-C5)-methyltransferase
VTATPDSPPLWRQLQACSHVLMAIRAGTSGTAALDDVAASLRPGVQALVFQVLRSLGSAQVLRKLLASRTPSPASDALLCTALALAWSDTDAPYEAFTLVNQAVEAAKRTPATRAHAGFINGCLRRFLRERQALTDAALKDPVAQWNHPAWWIARLQKDYPQMWQALLTANNQRPPMTLRVNLSRTPADRYRQQLAEAGIESSVTGQSGLKLARPVPVQQIPGFAQGDCSVQDGAAQMAAPLLLDGLDMTQKIRVLDACAAPGGKTAHLLELARPGLCEVTAMDIDASRCDRIHQNLQRLGLSAKVLVGDASQPQTWWDGQLFDAVLLDAPCTASGIVRRHPDIRWLRRETDITQLAGIQAGLLKSLWELVKPGGRLLYCTCSVFPAEGRDQIQTFLAHNTDAALLPSPGHLLPLFGAKHDGVPDNRNGDHDGFFYALLEKRTA